MPPSGSVCVRPPPSPRGRAPLTWRVGGPSAGEASDADEDDDDDISEPEPNFDEVEDEEDPDPHDLDPDHKFVEPSAGGRRASASVD